MITSVFSTAVIGWHYVQAVIAKYIRKLQTMTCGTNGKELVMREIIFRGKIDKKSPFAYGNLHIVAYGGGKLQAEGIGNIYDNLELLESK